MLNSAVIAFLAFSLLSCMFALVKGGTAERLGAGVILTNLVLMFGLQAILPPSTMSIVQLGLDAVTAVDTYRAELQLLAAHGLATWSDLEAWADERGFPRVWFQSTRARLARAKRHTGGLTSRRTAPG